MKPNVGWHPCSTMSRPECALDEQPLLEPNRSLATQHTQMTDTEWMQRCLALADEAERHGEVPVAAMVVVGDELVASGFNRNIVDNDPSAHAEVVAMRAAGRAIGNHRLVNATLYCTLEPCLMCTGAMIHARVRRLVYAASDPKTGAVHSVFNGLLDPRHNHRVEVEVGVLADIASEKLRTFFRARRGRD